MKQVIAVILLFATSLWGLQVAARASGDDVRFLDGLRQRRLFALAEVHCQRRLATDQLSETERSQLTTELVRIYAEHAVNSPPQLRDARWQQAHRAAAEFGERYPDHPRRVLVEVQGALALLAEGELARMEAEVAAAQEPSFDAARQTIRQAVAALEAIDRQLSDAIPLAGRPATGSGQLSADELRSLQQNVRYQLARAYRNRALCYAEGSTDRMAALTGALAQLDRPLRELPPDSDLIWRIQVDQAECHRLLGAFGAAARVLGELLARKLSAEETLRVRAERVRLELAAGRRQDALETLALGRELEGTVSPELDFAHLETYVALWQAAGDGDDPQSAARWQQKSVSTVEFIEQTHGPYWARRAELLLISTGQSRSTGSVEILARTAGDLYLKSRLEEALATYDKAAAAAREAGLSEREFELAYKAALIEQQRGEHQQASRRFRELAQALRSHPLSGQAHWSAVANTAQVVQADAAVLSDYVDLLEEHLRDWPLDATTDEARHWLGQLRQAQREWALAIAAYRELGPDSPHFDAATEAACRCWLEWLAETDSRGRPVEELALQALDFCEACLAAEPASGEADAAALLMCATTAARVRLLYLPDRGAEAYPLLESALERSPRADRRRQSSARALMVAAAAAGDGPSAEPRGLLGGLQDASPQDLLDLVEVLSVLQQHVAESRRAEIAGLELDVIARLSEDASTLAANRQRLGIARARALSRALRHEEAIAAYAALADEYRDDAQIQHDYAQALLESQDRTTLEKALEQWRLVAHRSPPRSPRWFRAKYAVALAHFKLGDRRGAVQRIRYLQATEDLESSGLQEEFAELLKRAVE